MDRDRPERARDLLEPLVASSPDNPDFHSLLGYARALSGDVWGGLSAFEEASALSNDPALLFPLASLYMEAGLGIHALQVFRGVIDQGVSTPMMKEVRGAATSLEHDLAQTAQHLGRPLEQVERGLYDVEQGQRAVSENDFHASVPAFRRAVKRLGDWPPPHNNLSQALFYDGQLEEAMKEVRGVLAGHPENLQALSNGIRFLTWSGREEEARDLWERLKDISPRDAKERMKKAEAAAVLAHQESVYQTLKPLDEAAAVEELSPPQMRRAQYFLAVAEANTGRRRQAKRRLQALHREHFAAETLAALKAGQSGIGWAKQFRYFHLLEMLPRQYLDALLALLAQEDEMPPERFHRRLERFTERFPQLVPVAEQMIWDEQQPEAGIGMLSTVGTREAYAALRRFGLSQAGDDDARLDALSALVEAGEIEKGETVRAWVDGEWREMELRVYEAPVGMWRESDYAPRVIETLNQALTAFHLGEVEQAEVLFERVLELNPNVKEAYNNLGTIYARREEDERALEMFRKAIEIDPTYVFPLCNLASYLLAEDQVEEAEALLTPLSEAEGLYPQGTAFYEFIRARILVRRHEYDSAEALLQTVLELQPDYEPARDLLEWIEGLGRWRDLVGGWAESVGSYWEEQGKRDRVWRERLQEKLSTLEPTLAEALPLCTKKGLTEMAREVMPWGGWSTLRKAELIGAIIEALTNPGNLERMLEDLTEEERDALRAVLDHGGAMVWGDFDARYGNDLDESRYWHWHTPETTMGQLRLHGFLVEATVDAMLYAVVPVDLREDLQEAFG
jgi:tetratricopeptide (TPR) repeat protein